MIGWTSCQESDSRQNPVRSSLLLAIVLGLALLLGACQKQAPSGDEAPAAAPTDQAATTDPAAPTEDSAASEPDAVELEFWKSVRDSEHTEDLWKYLERYPSGAFADLAKARIERLASGGGGDDAKAKSDQKTAPPPPAAGGSSGSSLRESRKARVKRVISRELRGFRDSRLHIAPDIPRFKLDNAASIHGFDPSRVLLLWDDGFRAGGKTGFVLTDRRMYWRFVAGSDAYFLDYEDIQTVRIRKNEFHVNGYEVGTTMSDNPRVAAERLGELIEALRDSAR